MSSAELTLAAPVKPAYEPVLCFEAPYLIEKLVKDRIVDTAEEAEALFAEAKKFLILSHSDTDVSWGMEMAPNPSANLLERGEGQSTTEIIRANACANSP